MKRRSATRTIPPIQSSLHSLPTEEPTAFLVWQTRTVRGGTKADPETWEFYETACKGHTFHVGLLPHGLFALHPEPPPSQWIRAGWQLLAQFEPGQHLEHMSSLFGCRSKEEALQLAEQHIAKFIREKRRQYD